jgi:hypothetical protein
MVGGNFIRKKKRPKTAAAAHDPVGLDIGTANIVVIKNGRSKVVARRELNAFFTVPSLPETKKLLTGSNIQFLDINEFLYILGNPAEEFALMMGGKTRRPMEGGLLNLGEDEGVNVIHAILGRLIPSPKNENEPLWFSIPGKPIDSAATAIFNESILKTYLENLGYSPRPINEGMAVVVSELSGGPATGIGISIGGGMCNVCCSYLSIPVVTYSIQTGGDAIDKMVAASVGESPVKIKAIKEKDLDLSALPKNSIEHGLHVCYEDLFSTLAKSLGQVLNASDNVPKLREPLPIILSGGTVLAPGSRDKFASILRKVKLPFEISDIVLAKKPLYATARGAYLMAAGRENT